MITMQLPAQLARLADLPEGHRQISLDGTTLGEAMANLDLKAPMLRSQLVDADGCFRQFVGFFVDGQQLEELGDGTMPLRPGSEIVVVAAVAGG